MWYLVGGSVYSYIWLVSDYQGTRLTDQYPYRDWCAGNQHLSLSLKPRLSIIVFSHPPFAPSLHFARTMKLSDGLAVVLNGTVENRSACTSLVFKQFTDFWDIYKIVHASPYYPLLPTPTPPPGSNARKLREKWSSERNVGFALIRVYLPALSVRLLIVSSRFPCIFYYKYHS